MKTLHKEPALRWHLKNNVLPQLSEEAINGIIKTCEDFNAGKVTLEHNVRGLDLTIGEMFNELKIEVQ